MALGLPLMGANINSILSLAEGSGGTLAILSEVLGVGECYYNSLNTETIDRRDDITDTLPTAFIALGRCSDLKDGRLARGTTDITSKVFQKKLNLFLKEKKIDMVTIDAENTNHSTNFNFVEDLVPILAYNQVKVVIVKMFHECDLEALIDRNLIEPYYLRFLFKPISSNPVETECLLVLLADSLDVPEGITMSLNKWWNTCKQYIKPDRGMTRLQMSVYLDVAKEISLRLRELCPAPPPL